MVIAYKSIGAIIVLTLFFSSCEKKQSSAFKVGESQNNIEGYFESNYKTDNECGVLFRVLSTDGLLPHNRVRFVNSIDDSLITTHLNKRFRVSWTFKGEVHKCIDVMGEFQGPTRKQEKWYLEEVELTSAILIQD